MSVEAVGVPMSFHSLKGEPKRHSIIAYLQEIRSAISGMRSLYERLV
jgi:cytochrome c2